MPENLQLRVHGAAPLPTLLYLPGLHGDWTLLAPFRAALAGRARLIEVAYPGRTDWELDDYAGAVEGALLERGIAHAWLLGESFSSQVAWQIIGRQQTHGTRETLLIDGLILAGGFVRHPWPRGVQLAHGASRRVPMWLVENACRVYCRLAGFHSRGCPELAEDLNQFVRRRTVEADRQAITSRYQLISRNDPRPVAQGARLPVFQLSGAIDPIVPWWQVRAWLRRHCPGYRTSRIIWTAGHNVLLSAPRRSAEQIVSWIRTED